MIRTSRHVGPYLFGIALALLLGCVTKTTVLVPPRVDLHLYRSIGLIDFSSNRGRPASSALEARS